MKMGRKIREHKCCLALLFSFGAWGLFLGGARAADPATAEKPAPIQFPLPNPSDIGIEQFENKLTAFLESGDFERTWQHDRSARSTGPFFSEAPEGVRSFATHGAGGVKVYYSPAMWEWLNGGRKGDIPDGAMMVKETFSRDAEDPEKFETQANAYTIMVRDKKGSWDGWYWTDGGPVKKPNASNAETFFDPNAGFGLACINCHASADNKFVTFASVRNVNSDPITYLNVIQTVPLPKPDSPTTIHTAPKPDAKLEPQAAKERGDLGYLKSFDKLPEKFTPEPPPFCSFDHVVQGPQPDGQRMFLTSSQCMPCHNASQLFSSLPNMALQRIDKNNSKTFINVSPYGEWRYSMMGLAGRDPVFYAQLESERALHPDLSAEIDNKCLSCHGAMGQRQLIADKGKDALFTHDMIGADPEKDPTHAKYGALARDGVSCMVCHQIQPEGLGTPESFTGAFKIGSKFNEVFGPYKDPLTVPMDHALGIAPKYGQQLSESKTCGSCHTVFTPSLTPGKKMTHAEFESVAASKKPSDSFHEQTTYLEWRNSIYSDEGKPNNAQKRSCQDCHMPKTFCDKSYCDAKLQFRTANIEDKNFPYVDSRASDASISLKVRGKDAQNPYSRHALNGINLFVLEMFNQFPWALGISRKDPLFPPNEVKSGLDVALESGLDFAQQETAEIAIGGLKRTEKGLEAEVTVTNLTGHRFPTGVGLRRAFIEFRVKSKDKTLWVSGGTDARGVIGTTDNGNGKFTALPTEFFEQNTFQPHHKIIDRENQVQIYEQIIADANGDITTSFMNYRTELKNNRLMPRGWSPKGPDAEHTTPVGPASQDPHYVQGDGTDVVKYQVPLAIPAGTPVTVTATLYYQSLSPSYLRDRFKYIDQPATKNLFYFVRQLNLDKKAMKDWKLEIVQDSKSLK